MTKKTAEATQPVTATDTKKFDEIVNSVHRLSAGLEQERRAALEFQIRPKHLLIAFGLGAWAAAIGAACVTKPQERAAA